MRVRRGILGTALPDFPLHFISVSILFMVD